MDLYVIGAGGHGEVVLDAVRAAGECNVVGFLDSNQALHGREVDGVPVLGLPALANRPFIVAIGDNEARKSVTDMLSAKGLENVTVIHPTAHVAPSARVGAGTLICAGAIICTRARIGRGVIINTGAVAEHHNVIEDFVHIAPRTVMAGRVTIREGAMIGSGSTIIPFITVGEWSTVGAGSVVTREVPAGVTVMGVPARVVRRGDQSVPPPG